MRKLIFLLLIFPLSAIIFSACENQEKTLLDPEAEVSFNISELMDGGLKDGWSCQTDGQGNLLEPHYAVVIISTTPDPDATGDVEYKLDVFRVMGQLYSQTIKLDPGNYFVKKFVLYNDNGTPLDTTDDILVMGTPETGSEFAQYVAKPVDFEFTVVAFQKIEIKIEVLCFLPALYQSFGFVWFEVTQIVIRELCFFTDICLNGDPWFPESFVVPPYGPPVPGIDVVGAMRIWVYKGPLNKPYSVVQVTSLPDGDPNFTPVPHSPFTNWDEQEGLLTGPLCVQYPDNLLKEDYIWFWIQFYLPDATGGFSWQTYAVCSLNGLLVMRVHDGTLVNLIDRAGDGIYDFVVGSCGQDGVADWTFDWLYGGLR
jgi:hypothetical protein